MLSITARSKSISNKLESCIVLFSSKFFTDLLNVATRVFVNAEFVASLCLSSLFPIISSLILIKSNKRSLLPSSASFVTISMGILFVAIFIVVVTVIVVVEVVVVVEVEVVVVVEVEVVGVFIIAVAIVAENQVMFKFGCILTET